MTDVELASAVLQLIVDQEPDRVVKATRDALLIHAHVLHEHDRSDDATATYHRLTYLAHLIGEAHRKAPA